MYSAKFIEELFKPQEVYTDRSTRQIFDRLAHSSIMRLNETSMDKVRADRLDEGEGEEGRDGGAGEGTRPNVRLRLRCLGCVACRGSCTT